MKRFVRLSALSFAIGSALFWQAVILIQVAIPELQLEAYGTEPGVLQDWLTTGLPTIIYGLACVLFCHWFARKIANKIRTQ